MGLYDSYVADLPAKSPFSAYPECLSKASLLTNAIEHAGVPTLSLGIDPEVRALIEAPPPVSSWVADARLYGAICALADGHGFGPPELREWVVTLSRRLYRQPIYRFLMLVVSPERLIRGMAKRWSALHKGTELLHMGGGEHQVLIELRRPRPVLGVVQPAMVAAIGVAIEEAGGKEVAVKLVEDSADALRMDWTWR